jgi:hypothetical protein
VQQYVEVSVVRLRPRPRAVHVCPWNEERSLGNVPRVHTECCLRRERVLGKVLRASLSGKWTLAMSKGTAHLFHARAAGFRVLNGALEGADVLVGEEAIVRAEGAQQRVRREVLGELVSLLALRARQ